MEKILIFLGCLFCASLTFAKAAENFDSTGATAATSIISEKTDVLPEPKLQEVKKAEENVTSSPKETIKKEEVKKQEVKEVKENEEEVDFLKDENLLDDDDFRLDEEDLSFLEKENFDV
ncbi:MAG: hypothetical protein UR14_C0006G0088 [candidate division TM6 bacterium GW2011_GWE2_31_21]|nr:MAG: hypothetical protein UR14_C0006G0088 [candidate division TM6 bacterium GW2011_GWE2_31_21]KKP53489.1 MAG: hypothetical protein UR43_C0004G0030 [candidate division TM6 bacterium GW2011_GWF2_33_332]